VWERALGDANGRVESQIGRAAGAGRGGEGRDSGGVASHLCQWRGH